MRLGWNNFDFLNIVRYICFYPHPQSGHIVLFIFHLNNIIFIVQIHFHFIEINALYPHLSLFFDFEFKIHLKYTAAKNLRLGAVPL